MPVEVSRNWSCASPEDHPSDLASTELFQVFILGVQLPDALATSN